MWLHSFIKLFLNLPKYLLEKVFSFSRPKYTRRLLLLNKILNTYLNTLDVDLSNFTFTTREIAHLLNNNRSLTNLFLNIRPGEPVLTTLISVLPKLKELRIDPFVRPLKCGRNTELDLSLLKRCSSLRFLSLNEDVRNINSLIACTSLTSL